MWVVLLILIPLLIVLGLFLQQVMAGASRRSQDPTELMDADSRSLFNPIRRLVADIEAVAAKKDSMVARVMGAESVEEARRIREQCAKALIARTELRKASRDKSVAELDYAELSRKAEAAATESERQALLSAKAARELEIQHYQTATEAIGRIDSAIRQTEAALGEMKARLAVAASNEKATTSGADDLRDTIGRLKALSVSYDEAENLLRQ